MSEDMMFDVSSGNTHIIKPDQNYKAPLFFVILIMVLFAALAGWFYTETFKLNQEIELLNVEITDLKSTAIELEAEADTHKLMYSELVGSVNIYLRSVDAGCEGSASECLEELTFDNLLENEATESASPSEDAGDSAEE